MMAITAGFIPYRTATICGSAPKRTHAAAIIETRRAAGIMKQQPATMRPNQPLFRKPMNMASSVDLGRGMRLAAPSDQNTQPIIRRIQQRCWGSTATQSLGNLHSRVYSRSEEHTSELQSRGHLV